MANNLPESASLIELSEIQPLSCNRFLKAAPGALDRNEMEKRRLEAVKDLLMGLPQSTVALKFGVSRTTASRWNRALRQNGVEALRKRQATGRPSRLSRDQLLLIPDIFAMGAVVHGFPDNRWTTARFASVIEARFGIHYDHDHVGRLMHKMGLRVPRTQNAGHGFAAHGAPHLYGSHKLYTQNIVPAAS